MSYPQKEIKTDAIADWSIDKNGREFINYDKVVSGKTRVFSKGFLDKLDLVMTNKLPQTGNEDEQESANAWTFEKQTYSVSQFKSNNGLMTLIYKGPSKKASNTPLVKPDKKQQTLEESSGDGGNNSGQYKKGNYGKGNNNYYQKNIKTVVSDVCVEPRVFATIEEAYKDTLENPGRGLFYKDERYIENGNRGHLTGKPLVL